MTTAPTSSSASPVLVVTGSTPPPANPPSPALNALQQQQTGSDKTFIAKLEKGITAFFKKIERLILAIFCCLDDSDSMDLTDPPPLRPIDSLTEIERSLKRADIPPQNPPPAAPPSSVSTPASPPVYVDKVLAYDQMRATCKLELINTAAVIELKRAQGTVNEKLLPHKNLNHYCFMISALRSLAHAYMILRPVKELIGSDLTWKDQDTLDSLEARLNQWAPIPKQGDTTALEGQIALYEAQKLQADNVLDKNGCDTEIIKLRNQLNERENKILFKWSLLLYFQAVRYGTAQELNRALFTHYQVCSMINPQQDSADEYMQFWHQMLGLGLNIDNEDCPILRVRSKDSVKSSVADLLASKKFKSGPKPGIVNLSFNRTGKVNGRLESPIACDELLDLNEYFEEKDPTKAYKVIAFTLHEKTAGGVHYISYTLANPATDAETWYLCDDERVVPVAKEDVPLEQACTLTYVRVNC